MSKYCFHNIYASVFFVFGGNIYFSRVKSIIIPKKRNDCGNLIAFGLMEDCHGLYQAVAMTTTVAYTPISALLFLRNLDLHS